MTELEKLEAGLEYSFWDEEVNARKLRAIAGCKKLNAVDSGDEKTLEREIRELFGTGFLMRTAFSKSVGIHA